MLMCVSCDLSNHNACRLHVGVAGGRFVDFWVRDDEEYLEALSARRVFERCGQSAKMLWWKMCTYTFWSSQGDPRDAWHLLQAKFADRLASLLLIARVDSNLRTSRDVGFSLTSLVLGF